MSRATNNLLLNLYLFLPKGVVKFIGSLSFLKGIRDKILRNKSGFKESQVLIRKDYIDHKVEFKYIADIRGAAKAKKKGVETNLILNTMALINNTKFNTILDIGSNFGFLSLVWSKTLASKGQVYGFEPNPQTYKCFKRSVALNNLNNIKIENVAVGSNMGATDIYINNSTSNILEKTGNKAQATLITIDQYYIKESIKKCDMIKIDVDGYELEVLIGAINTIKKFKPVLIIETNESMEVVDFVRSLGYKILDGNLSKNFEGIPANIFCTS